ncbi:IclR family transcriptional regulator [Yoonia sp. SS1-5]|uniref:IclR family transcriptional regulator n=1 Tax=Yoonia rhodophyticola TaxID=3137370 RepID=A0AAN0NKS6_9RHOB
MSSTTKALELLAHFSALKPEIGLSEMCRLAKRDKATTYRHLMALEAAGFVEQNHKTKGYRLGPALLQLGRLREQTVPRETGAAAPMSALSELSGETVHVTVLSSSTIFALLSQESPKHSTRAVIDIATFPLHATASGICALAFGPDDLFAIACEDLAPFTPTTPTTADGLRILVEDARSRGIARSNGQFETDIHSLSSPIFDQDGAFAGAVSVASVATRFTASLEQIITEGLIQASRDITRNWGGIIPQDIETAWSKAIASCKEMEQTS